MPETPKTLTTAEQERLLGYLYSRNINNIGDAVPIRNYTMACFMLYAGLRVGELVQLRIDDVWYDTEPKKSLVVRPEIAKNKTERTIPLCLKILNAVHDLKSHWFAEPLDNPGPYIFRQGNSYAHITTRRVHQIISATSERSIGRKIHPHVLRHTFGTRLMRITNARVVQQLLGHSSLASTQIYTHPNQDDLTEAINGL